MSENKSSSDRKVNKRQIPSRFSDSGLSISASILDDAAVAGIIDECIVPALVKAFLRKLEAQPNEGGK